MAMITIETIINDKSEYANEMRTNLANGFYRDPVFVQGMVDQLDAEISYLKSLPTTPSMTTDAAAFAAKFMRGAPNLEFLMARMAKLNEELSELATGCVINDDAEIADALIDIVYVALVTATKLGYPVDELWASVHESNMTRTPRGLWQASKGPDFVPNNSVGIMSAHGF